MQTMVTGGALRFPLRFSLAKPKPNEAFAFLKRHFSPRSVFMDIGASSCDLALLAASYVERAYAIDVSGQFLHSVAPPPNLRLVLCDGVRIPVPEASVDVAWSGQFLDQLHPDDQLEHLKSVRRSLVPGGIYFSRRRARFLDVGFSAVRCYAGSLRVPLSMASLVPEGSLRFAAVR